MCAIIIIVAKQSYHITRLALAHSYSGYPGKGTHKANQYFPHEETTAMVRSCAVKLILPEYELNFMIST